MRPQRVRVSDSELQETFLILDDRFFDGFLRDHRTSVAFASDKKCENAFGVTIREENAIYINEEVRRMRRFVRILLLHEMAHAKLFLEGYVSYNQYAGHSTLHHAAIDRLYRIGAYEGLL